MKNKKKSSPSIKIVLIVVAVILIVVLVLLWASAPCCEDITKDGKPIAKVCGEAEFIASYELSNNEITVINNGNVPIYAFEARIYSEGRIDTQELIPKNIETGEEINLVQGTSGNISIDIGDATKIKLTPILIGNSGEREVKYTCHSHPGVELEI